MTTYAEHALAFLEHVFPIVRAGECVPHSSIFCALMPELNTSFAGL
jgi:hypothetical protein